MLSEIFSLTEDTTSDILWVVCLPAPLDPATKLHRRLVKAPGSKLWMTLDSPEFWKISSAADHRRKVEMLASHIAQVRERLGARRVLALGHSRGANAALVLGCLLGFERILVTVPELKIGRSHTRSAGLAADAQYGDLIPLLNAFQGQRIDLYLSCFSAKEGANLRFAQEITNPACHTYLLAWPHNRMLQFLVNQVPTLLDDMRSGSSIALDAKWLGDESEVRLALAAFDLVTSIERGDYTIPDVDDSDSRNDDWFFYKAKALWRQGRRQEALIAAERSVELRAKPGHVFQLGRFLIKMKAMARAHEIVEMASQLPDLHANEKERLVQLQQMLPSPMPTGAAA